MKKLLAIFTLVICLFTLVLTPAMAEEPYKIGFFVKDTTNSFWRYVVNGATIAAQEAGVELIEYTPVEASNVEEQINLIEDAITAQVDAICIVAVDSGAVIPALQKAMDAGIPVITFNSRVDLEGIKCFCGVENYEGYALVTEQVCADLGYEGNVVIIEGVAAGYANIERVRGAKDVCDKYEGITILDDQIGDNKRDQAMSVMENLLQTYGDEIDAVLAHNDNTAIGALQAIIDYGLEDEIIVVGFDGTVEGINSIQNGGLTYSLDQSPYQQGAYAVRAAVDVLNGNEIEFEIPTGGTLITAENAQAIIDEFYSTT